MQTSGTLVIGDLMEQSGVGFGTSGARGLAADMTDAVCYAYTAGFLGHMQAAGLARPGGRVALAGDYRPSSPRILAACARAVRDQGFEPLNCGDIPTPTLANYGLRQDIPSLMVTGSHIPDDRNGIKFNRPDGEILKADEAAIRARTVTLPKDLFTPDGAFAAGVDPGLPPATREAYEAYLARYLEFFPRDCLAGARIGLYEHSSVAREALYEILTGLGAEVTRLGRSEVFIPVDTEAIRPEDVDLARRWAGDGAFDCLVSTDGDGDRPLVSDERGEWLRGDIAGILCARYLGAQGVVTPVSSNSALERSGWFPRVLRTRIGSPYVIEGMQRLVQEGLAPVVGYEANGGFLTATAIRHQDRELPPLPTRDATIVALAILLLARARDTAVSGLAADLPQRFTASDRIKAFPQELARERLAAFASGDPAADKAAVEAAFGKAFGRVQDIDLTDGVRITFIDGDVLHLRPSGNAPELRAYTEAASPQRAREMNRTAIEIMAGWR